MSSALSQASPASASATSATSAASATSPTTVATAPGTLFGIGVGPGSPDLMTLRAVERLGRADVILAAASPRNEHSVALSIARPYLRPGVETLRLDFPMTRDKAVLREAWDKNAALAAAQLRQGKNAAFLTLGDPLVYSTFGYLLRTLQALMPDLPVDIVPGVTSFQAAAAHTGTILCEGKEALHVLPGILDGEALKDCLDHPGRAVILKAYRNFPAIRASLEAAGRADDAVFVSQLGLEGETVRRGMRDVDKPPYLSLVIAGAPRKD